MSLPEALLRNMGYVYGLVNVTLSGGSSCGASANTTNRTATVRKRLGLATGGFWIYVVAVHPQVRCGATQKQHIKIV